MLLVANRLLERVFLDCESDFVFDCADEALNTVVMLRVLLKLADMLAVVFVRLDDTEALLEKVDV